MSRALVTGPKTPWGESNPGAGTPFRQVLTGVGSRSRRIKAGMSIVVDGNGGGLRRGRRERALRPQSSKFRRPIKSPAGRRIVANSRRGRSPPELGSYANEFALRDDSAGTASGFFGGEAGAPSARIAPDSANFREDLSKTGMRHLSKSSEFGSVSNISITSLRLRVEWCSCDKRVQLLEYKWSADSSTNYSATAPSRTYP